MICAIKIEWILCAQFVLPLLMRSIVQWLVVTRFWSRGGPCYIRLSCTKFTPRKTSTLWKMVVSRKITFFTPILAMSIFFFKLYVWCGTTFERITVPVRAHVWCGTRFERITVPSRKPLKIDIFILVSVYSSVIVSSTDLCFNSQNHVVFRMICGVSFLKVFVLGGGLKGCWIELRKNVSSLLFVVCGLLLFPPFSLSF